MKNIITSIVLALCIAVNLLFGSLAIFQALRGNAADTAKTSVGVTAENSVKASAKYADVWAAPEIIR